MRPTMLFFLALSACHAAEPAETPSSRDKPESRATAMPEQLRCRVATDCAPEVTCYWGTPSCVAVASAPAPVKCGEDADPPRPEIGCACNDGQCTAVEK